MPGVSRVILCTFEHFLISVWSLLLTHQAMVAEGSKNPLTRFPATQDSVGKLWTLTGQVGEAFSFCDNGFILFEWKGAHFLILHLHFCPSVAGNSESPLIFLLWYTGAKTFLFFSSSFMSVFHIPAGLVRNSNVSLCFRRRLWVSLNHFLTSEAERAAGSMGRILSFQRKSHSLWWRGGGLGGVPLCRVAWRN